MKLIKPLIMVIALVYLAGCASGAQQANMVYQGAKKQYPTEIRGNVEIGEVSGGKKTNPAWTSQIDNESFSYALKESLKLQNLYAENGKYRLSVKMVKIQQPLLGLDMKVTTHIVYTLSHVDTGKLVFNETIVAPYKASMGDAFVGVTRLRLANEGSAQENIKLLLEKLSNLDIGANQISLAN